MISDFAFTWVIIWFEEVVAAETLEVDLVFVAVFGTNSPTLTLPEAASFGFFLSVNH